MDRDRGEVMIEAVFIIPIVLFCVMATLDMGMSLYHQEMVTASANEAAEAAARVYHSVGQKDPFFAITSRDDLKNMKQFRHLYRESEGKNNTALFAR